MDSFEYYLVIVNLIVYSLLVLVLWRPTNEIPENLTLEQAFAFLEDYLKRYYPSLKEGYTWQEVVSNLKSASPAINQIDWGILEESLNRYEAFKYGGISYGRVDTSMVIRLAQKLKKREKAVS
ncbi:MAG: hypothetical protein JRN20_08070 [Nitrososphaerota archaeon]|nr:hypothetical protein [Nitrososphaerota archaeon]MDG6922644.1 hypothetical protein [Nitrososphaerota archaeon]